MQGENTNRMTSGESETDSVNTNTNIPTQASIIDEAKNVLSEQPLTGLASANPRKEVYTDTNAPRVTRQADTQGQPVDRNDAISRALIGGLIGASLGSLAGALAGRRIGQGLKIGAKGLPNISKTIGEGGDQTAKGLGEALRFIAQEASQAVIAGVLDIAQGVAEEATQTTASTADAVQSTVHSAGQFVQDTANKALDTLEGAKPLQSQENLYQDPKFADNQIINHDEHKIDTTDVSLISGVYNLSLKTEDFIMKSMTPGEAEIRVLAFCESD